MISIPIEYPDFSTYEENITSEKNINYLDAKKFEKTLSYYDSIANTCDELTSRELRVAQGGNNLIGTGPTKIPLIFMSMGVPESLFKKRKNKSGISFDAKIQNDLCEYMVNTPFDNDRMYNLYYFTQMYATMKAARHVANNLAKPIAEGLITECDFKGERGIDLFEMVNHYERRSTGRYYAQKVSLVQLDKPILKCITVPADYFMLSVDLSQIDLRVSYNMFLRGAYPEEDRIFDAETEDKYKAMFCIVCRKMKVPENYEYFADNRKDFKTMILAAMYRGGVSTLSNIFPDATYTKAFVDYFKDHSNHSKICDRIERLYKLGASFTITDYFGFEIDISLDKSTADDPEDRYYLGKAWADDDTPEQGSGDILPLDKVVKRTFARAVQSTSNSIIVHWVNYVMKMAEETGLTSGQLWISAIRHDESVFAVHKSALDKLDFLFNSLQIQIADWDMITFDAEVYIHYKEDEEGDLAVAETLDGYRKYINDHYLSKIYPPVPKDRPKYYHGIPDVHELYGFSLLEPMALATNLIPTSKCKTDEEAIALIVEFAEAGMLPAIYKAYADIWDLFVIKNVNTTNVRCVKGIENLTIFVNEYNLKYIKGTMVQGFGLEILGDCYVFVDSLDSKVATEYLISASEGNVKMISE